MKYSTAQVWGITCSLIWLFVLFVTSINWFRSHDYYNSECYIYRIDYPITLPTLNDTSFWEECDCGHNCQAWYPCVKLYTEESSTFLQEVLDGSVSSCTFFENECNDGEDVIITQKYLQEAISLAEKYYNTTIDCYKPSKAHYDDYNGTMITDEKFYMDLAIDYIYIYIFIGFAGLSLCCFIGCFFHDNCTFSRRSNQEQSPEIYYPQVNNFSELKVNNSSFYD